VVRAYWKKPFRYKNEGALLHFHDMGKGSWGEEKKEKVQGEEISRGACVGEISSKELVKTRFFSTGHGVRLEGKEK